MSFLIILNSCFLIHMFSRTRYFKSINLFFGVILVQISPKAFHWECCYLWCVSMIQVISLSSWWKKIFISSVLSIILFVSVVAEFRLNFEKFSISPLQAYSFRCWVSNNSVITFLEGCFPSSFVAEVGIFSYILLFQ